MKKITFFMLPLAFALIGCAAKPVNIAEYTPTALVSVTSNATISWYDEEKASDQQSESGGLLSGVMNRTLGSENPEIQTRNARLDMAADSLRTLLDKNGIEVIAQDIVQNSKTVKLSNNAFVINLEDTMEADGYIDLNPSGTKRNRQIMEETGASSLIFADFLFQRRKLNSGLIGHEVAAYTTLKIRLVGKDGKKVMEKSYTAQSSKSTVYKNGRWDKEEFCTFFPETIDSVINQFIMDCVVLSDTGSSLSSSLIDDSSATTLTVRRDAVQETDEY